MSSERATLLVVDDDAEIRELIQAYLAGQGYDVICAEDAPAMDKVLAASSVDLILLDLMLPGEDGLSIAKRLKASSNTPIIMVSAQGEEVDRIVGLEIGADDYIGKPFNPRELLARIRAVMRRNTAPDVDRRVVAFGTFSLDLNAHRLTEGDHTVPLTSGEYDLLSVLVRYPNKVLDRDRIVELLSSGQRSPFDRSVDVRVTRLRSKIEPDPSAPCYIRTVWGKGYMFCPGGSGQ